VLCGLRARIYIEGIVQGNINVGYGVPDYTAYEELLGNLRYAMAETLAWIPSKEQSDIAGGLDLWQHGNDAPNARCIVGTSQVHQPRADVEGG
jgi:hypothetical protein